MTPSQLRTTAAPVAPLALVLALAIALAACHPGARVSTTPRPAAQPRSAAAGQEQGEAAAIARARADSVRHPYTEADIRFMSDMIHHHAQAIVMARMAPSHGASPSIQTLAARIINAQQDEIRTMQQWLRDRQLPVPDPTAPMAMPMAHDAGHDMAMHDMAGMHGAGHTALMPGMLTPEQLARLDSARGPEFDTLFLRDMIQHHSGALTMVKELMSSYGAAQDDLVFKLASDINVDQTTEIARMRRMLLALQLGIDAEGPSE